MSPSLKLAAQSQSGNFIDGLDQDSFVLTPTAILWLIPSGTVDAYAFGVSPIKVPYSEIRHRLRIRLDL
ncbi:MAG: hypothetical protein NZM28_09885 [Fimbriimonadales bacterium]|nr:hypothetical protein [Fimbriimonadales bacterium]